MNGLLARARSLWRGLLRPGRLAADMEEEMRFHVEMEAERLARERGLPPAEARRQAAVAFGGIENHKEQGRDARGLTWIHGLSLDLRLGLRMLVKYPGLAGVGVLGMAVAIGFGAGLFSFVAAVVDPALPLDEGHRIVAVQNLDAARNDQARETQLHDLAAWREGLRAVEELGAYRTVDRNLLTPDGRAEPLRIAEMSASGFRVARVPPLLGRWLVDEDERPGAPPVVVVGYDVWQRRFAGDPGVVGRTLRLGNDVHTVVGVMPEGFAFPVNNRLWAPLRLDPLVFERGEAPPIDVFGRLAPGATLEQAQAQLEILGRRTAAAHPDTHRHVRPRVLPYARSFIDAPELAWALYLVQLLGSLLLGVIAVNVAILVYARTAARAGEIAVRLALGAGRARVVAQLFAEALVLSLAAAAVGLVGAGVWARQANAYMDRMAGEQVPFWWKIALSGNTVAYVVGLAVLGAVIVGVIPALKATGPRVQSTLRALGGGTGMRMGRTWTFLVVAQVAAAVAILPPTTALAWQELFPAGAAAPDFDAEGIFTAGLGMDRETPPGAEAERYEREFAARLAARQAELAARVEAEPGVAAATYVGGVTGGVIEVEGPRPGAESTRHGVRYLEVDPGVFDAFGAAFLAGRVFRPEDLAGAPTAVVVNRSFAEQVLGGAALGRRFRYVRAEDGALPGGTEAGAWYEVVGVVEDFPVELPYRWEGVGTLYHPAAPGRLDPATLVVRTRGVAPEGFAARLREVTTALDPTLRLGEVRSVSHQQREEARTRRLLTLGILVAVLSVVLLSAAGIHALMSFTVAQRRREIGIRMALGAHPRRLLASVFARALRQLGAGAALGGLLGSAAIAGGEDGAGQAAGLLLAVAALMLTVGMLAALGPARRGLRIQPMEALRED
ncbi:MAG TPA: ABC transporter permease [Longimicrobiaceae bacterium]|nr:ABC transporter permease [Longimicrobiaceae bacterium]